MSALVGSSVIYGPGPSPATTIARHGGRRLLAAFVILPMAVMGLAAWHVWNETWTAASRDLHYTSEVTSQFGQRTFSAYSVAAGRIDAVLRGLSDDEIREREAQLHAEMAEIVTEVPQAEGSFVLDRTGGVLVSGNVFPVPRGAVAADREFFTALRADNAPTLHVSPVYTGRLDGTLFSRSAGVASALAMPM